MDYKNISKKVDALIAHKGFSVSWVERKADLGNGTIRSWRQGRNIKIDSIVKVADVLGVTVDDLVKDS